MMPPEPGKFWFTLDNAAKIFPAVITKEVTSVFRLTAVLKHPVNIRSLQKALVLAEKRFPYYRVRLRQGFFWFYLEYNPRHISLEADDNVLCRKFPDEGLLIRLLVRDNHLSAEFSHILTDGSGAFEFFKTVIINYFGICGVSISGEYQISEPVGPISEEEYEDAYNRYFKAEIPPIIRRSGAFHLPFPLKSLPRFTRLCAVVSLNRMKSVVREKGVSITVYLGAVYLFVLQEIFESRVKDGKLCRKKKLRIQVPVNLRNVFPTKTMRNFTLFVMPEIDLRLGHYTFDEIVKSVYHQIKLETDVKLIHKNISRNVGSEKKLYVRGIPLFLKSFILRLKYYSLGTKQYSGVLTNLGKIDLPGGTGGLVDYFIMTPPPPNKMLKLNCGVAGFGDKLVLSFGNVTKSLEFEEKFLHFLSDQNIAVEREPKA
jgi:hypothetical protein